jgi:ornithine cyclodeaminase/alanine dehydrogenase-like protein (mu-crystallin family)
LFLREIDIEGLVTMADVLAAVEAVEAARARGEAWQEPRRRLRMPKGMLHTMSAAWPARGVFAHKAYAAVGGDVRFRVSLYDAATGAILAVMEGNRLGQLRTGAATAVAARRLAPARPQALALFGTGLQAWGQLEALAEVMLPAEVRVFGRRSEAREDFAARARGAFGFNVRAVESASACLAGADVVVTATTSKDPVFDGRELAQGAFVAAVGANLRIKRELDGQALRRFDRIIVDDLATAENESGLLLTPIESGHLQWSQIRDLPDLVAGRAAARQTPSETLLFHSLGSAVWDVAAALVAWEKARVAGVGQQIALD